LVVDIVQSKKSIRSVFELTLSQGFSYPLHRASSINTTTPIIVPT
jgi:hypothetical protein